MNLLEETDEATIKGAIICNKYIALLKVFKETVHVIGSFCRAERFLFALLTRCCIRGKGLCDARLPEGAYKTTDTTSRRPLIMCVRKVLISQHTRNTTVTSGSWSVVVAQWTRGGFLGRTRRTTFGSHPPPKTPSVFYEIICSNLTWSRRPVTKITCWCCMLNLHVLSTVLPHRSDQIQIKCIRADFHVRRRRGCQRWCDTWERQQPSERPPFETSFKPL